ncbi:MAG: hypothetical protein GC178_17075 [Flavobacteriales bacterium]|nr:hypothetical protein [Flavobacteriales bacterium]
MGFRFPYICIGIFMLFAASGCKKNAGCTQFGSENYNPDAVFDDGSCILERDKFLGTFHVSSDCQNDYSCVISEGPGDFKVVFLGLADTLGEVDAKVYGQNITIEQQVVNSHVTIEGAGVYVADNGISLSYRMRYNSGGTETIYDCLESMTKQ